MKFKLVKKNYSQVATYFANVNLIVEKPFGMCVHHIDI